MEPLIEQMIEKQIEFSTGTGYPGAPKPEDVIRDLREQGVEIPPTMPPEDVEEKIVTGLETLLDRYCQAVKAIEINGADYHEGSYVYKCVHPRLGKFYIYLSELEEATSGKSTLSVKFTRNQAEALQRFNDYFEYLLDKYDATDLESLEKELEQHGFEVWAII